MGFSGSYLQCNLDVTCWEGCLLLAIAVIDTCTKVSVTKFAPSLDAHFMRWSRLTDAIGDRKCN